MHGHFLKKSLKNIFHIDTYVRVVFSSMMVLPVIILFYFIGHFSKTPHCMSLYLKNKPVSIIKPIAWPHHGLLTLWFDNAFFEENNKIIMPVMNQHHFSGMISLANDERCPVSLSKLMMLHRDGWEITTSSALKVVSGQHEINDMPAADAEYHVIYDMSHPVNEALFGEFLTETKTRNGWIVLYFHTTGDAQKSMSSAQWHRILQIIQHSKIPVVLQSQVLKVSQ
ncbi:MAG TPA: hypothetical protein DDY37_03265 [Legionella sp.]|nr:hypothetical protein [Legionella sp.]